MKLLICIAFVCGSFVLKAQTGYQEITDKRINFISAKLSLTPDEAQQFWPLFREYHIKREKATVNRKNLKTVKPGLSQEEYLEIANEYIAAKTIQAVLLEEYHKKYLEILPAGKVLDLYKLDEEFNRDLLKKIKEAGKKRK